MKPLFLLGLFVMFARNVLNPIVSLKIITGGTPENVLSSVMSAETNLDIKVSDAFVCRNALTRQDLTPRDIQKTLKFRQNSLPGNSKHMHRENWGQEII